MVLESVKSVIRNLSGISARIALYTAFSRAKSESGLYIVGNLKLSNKLSEKDPVYLELMRLKAHCNIIWSIPLISPYNYVHNVRSLNKHWEDLIVNHLSYNPKC